MEVSSIIPTRLLIAVFLGAAFVLIAPKQWTSPILVGEPFCLNDLREKKVHAL
jgi:ABC-type Na+ efflux pump permease subunit